MLAVFNACNLMTDILPHATSAGIAGLRYLEASSTPGASHCPSGRMRTNGSSPKVTGLTCALTQQRISTYSKSEKWNDGAFMRVKPNRDQKSILSNLAWI